MSEETTKYQQQCENYQDDKGKGCLMAVIALPILVTAVYISRNFPDLSNTVILGIFITIGIFAFFSFYKGNFKCPRCKENFDYIKTNTPTDKCINCKLPIFYGSSYFFDYWGLSRETI